MLLAEHLRQKEEKKTKYKKIYIKKNYKIVYAFINAKLVKIK